MFPYSERPGTPAARMPAVPKPVRKQRAAALRAGRRRPRHAVSSPAQVGRTVSLLTEAEQSGHTEHFAPVRLSQPAAAGHAAARAGSPASTDDALLAEAA